MVSPSGVVRCQQITSLIAEFICRLAINTTARVSWRICVIFLFAWLNVVQLSFSGGNTEGNCNFKLKFVNTTFHVQDFPPCIGRWWRGPVSQSTCDTLCLLAGNAIHFGKRDCCQGIEGSQSHEYKWMNERAEPVVSEILFYILIIDKLNMQAIRHRMTPGPSWVTGWESCAVWKDYGRLKKGAIMAWWDSIHLHVGTRMS